jgi:CheY-like chemotaxis protein
MEKKIKILLVDDELDYVRPIAFWLESKGYLVMTAQNGQAGLDTIKKDRPDIVFLDLKMPVMDGIETLQRIRKTDKEIPIIIVTVEYANYVKLEQADKLGISGFFPKKGSFEEMESMIEATLRTHKNLKNR